MAEKIESAFMLRGQKKGKVFEKNCAVQTFPKSTLLTSLEKLREINSFSVLVH